MKASMLFVLGIMFISAGVFVNDFWMNEKPVSKNSLMCISEDDNDAVIDFKQQVILMTLQEDYDNGNSLDSIATKYKYFNPCN